MKKIFLFSALLSGSSMLYAKDLVPEKMLKAHNIWREKVDVSALVWSDKLQSKAQSWANELKIHECKMGHSPADSVGENLYWASARKRASSKDAQGNWIWKSTIQVIKEQDVVDSWGSEQKWYHLENNKCYAPTGDSCGHYTQVVWKKTTEIGCAKAICQDLSQVWVCHYSPAGNVIGRKPY